MVTMSWDNNELQFARLICEIVAAEERLNWPEIRDSMDLNDEELHELFDRAHDVFEAAKRSLFLRQLPPERDNKQEKGEP